LSNSWIKKDYLPLFTQEKENMTKAEIVEAVCRNANLSKKEATDITETIFEIIRQSLEHGESIKLPGFGNFSVREKSVRVGRNPKTGEEMEISARKVVSFKPSQILRDRVQG
jgi:integration host factor subunit alpha